MKARRARLRERVTVQAKNLVDNGKGGRARPPGGAEWIDAHANIPAEIVPLRGEEALQNAVLRSVQLYKVTLRSGLAINAANRLLWGSIAMNIKALALTTDRRELVITAEAGGAAQ